MTNRKDLLLQAGVLLGVLGTLAPHARAAEPLDQLEQKAFRAAVHHVAPSVVRIETVGGLERVGRLLLGTGPTTGLVVDPDGYIISSAFNFINKPASILVQLPDGTRKPAKLVATDHNRMIALLKVDPPKPLPVPEIAPPPQCVVGQWAIAVGRAFEGNQVNTAVGMVSALNRIWGKAIQTDAAVSPNNYGGPLVDIQGRVMGVLVPLSPQDTSEVSGYEWYDSGIGFAIPAQKVQELLPRLKQGKDLMAGLIGIGFASQALFMADPVISACRPGSPAYLAGLRKGDRIVEVAGQKIAFASQVKQEISRHYAGDKIKVTVERSGKRSEYEVELQAKLAPYQFAFLGILPVRPAEEAKSPAKEEAKPEAKPAAKPEKNPAGVTVRYVYPESPAAKAGIKPGDVLATVGGEPIHDASNLRLRLADLQPGDSVSLEIRRGGATQKIDAKLEALPEAIPPDGLPPAHEDRKTEGLRPAVGAVSLKSPEFPNDAWAYVPEGYDPTVSYGLVIWLQGTGVFNEKEIIARWKPACDRRDLILLAPKPADPGKWQPREAMLVGNLLGQLARTYRIDPVRVVTCGQGAGGTMAFGLAAASRNAVAGVVAIDAPYAGRMPETDPSHRLAFFLARAAKARSSFAVKDTIIRLRGMKHPTTVKELGPDPRPLTPDELGEIARWIDALDRI